MLRSNCKNYKIMLKKIPLFPSMKYLIALWGRGRRKGGDITVQHNHVLGK
jgi:hypothetical protein